MDDFKIVIIVPMDGLASLWVARQPFDLLGNRKARFPVSVSKKS
jgi:hypothetical protein